MTNPHSLEQKEALRSFFGMLQYGTEPNFAVPNALRERTPNDLLFLYGTITMLPNARFGNDLNYRLNFRVFAWRISTLRKK